MSLSEGFSEQRGLRVIHPLTIPPDVCSFLNQLGRGFVQKRNFGGFPFGDGAKNDGVGVIFGNGVEIQVDTVVSGFFHVLCDVRVIILRSCFMISQG